MRVQNSSTNAAVEIFLDDTDKSLKVIRLPDTENSRICGYGLTEKRAAVEFFAEVLGDAVAVTVEESCRMAQKIFYLGRSP